MQTRSPYGCWAQAARRKALSRGMDGCFRRWSATPPSQVLSQYHSHSCTSEPRAWLAWLRPGALDPRSTRLQANSEQSSHIDDRDDDVRSPTPTQATFIAKPPLGLHSPYFACRPTLYSMPDLFIEAPVIMFLLLIWSVHWELIMYVSVSLSIITPQTTPYASRAGHFLSAGNAHWHMSPTISAPALDSSSSPVVPQDSSAQVILANLSLRCPMDSSLADLYLWLYHLHHSHLRLKWCQRSRILHHPHRQMSQLRAQGFPPTRIWDTTAKHAEVHRATLYGYLNDDEVTPNYSIGVPCFSRVLFSRVSRSVTVLFFPRLFSRVSHSVTVNLLSQRWFCCSGTFSHLTHATTPFLKGQIALYSSFSWSDWLGWWGGGGVVFSACPAIGACWFFTHLWLQLSYSQTDGTHINV